MLKAQGLLGSLLEEQRTAFARLSLPGSNLVHPLTTQVVPNACRPESGHAKLSQKKLQLRYRNAAHCTHVLYSSVLLRDSQVAKC